MFNNIKSYTMTAEEFMEECGITPDKVNNEILYKLIGKLMEGYANQKQKEVVEHFEQLGKELFKTSKPKPTIIMP